MASPVTPSEFKALIPTAAGPVCDKLTRALFTFPTKFCQWFSYVYDESGEFTTAFKQDICGIDCEAIVGGDILDAPTVSSEVQVGSALFTWGAVDGASYYEIVRNTINDLSTASLLAITTLTTYADTTGTENTYYYYWVRARSTSGIGQFCAVQVCYSSGAYPGYPPFEPVVVTATTHTPDCVQLSWPVLQGALEYDVWRSATADVNAGAKLTTTAYRYWNDFTATTGTTYYYFVRAHNEDRWAEYSVGVVGIKQA